MSSPVRISKERLAARLGVAVVLSLWSSGAGAVVGGDDAPDGRSATAVMVLSSRGGVCSAVIVAPDAVLTAGHCVAGADEHRVHWKAADGTPVLLQPSARALHPGYRADAVANRRRSIDLALLRLPEPLPAPFAAARISAQAPVKGSALRLGGYGVAREGEPRTSGTFRTAALVTVEPYGPSSILLWASSPDGTRGGACQGDSGGPISDEGGAVLAIASWATGAGGRGCGGVTQGVLLGPQRGWIDDTLAGWGRRAAWH